MHATDNLSASQQWHDFYLLIANRDDCGGDARWREQDIRDRQHLVVAPPVKVEEFSI